MIGATIQRADRNRAHGQGRRRLIALVLFLIVSGGLCYSAVYQAPVYDELGHWYAGLRYWQFGDVYTFKVNPPVLRGLAALLSRPAGELPEVDFDLSPVSQLASLDELLQLAEQCNPELQGLVWQIARDRQKQRLACLQRYPDFQVGMNWLMVTQQDAISPVANGNDNFAFTVGMTLPIWRDKIRAGISEAAHQSASSIEMLDAERNLIGGKIRHLVAQADALADQYQIFEDKIIPRTEQTLEINLADYRGKRSEFFSVVETYRELLSFELQQLRLATSLSGTLIQIQRQVGCPIPTAEPQP
ncbi:MAG: hypothetical protein KatS3mg111_0464 [Pirellulaceae bacterium]|nr:MAG: hypothetical protein KatS3mg111_0464 [Pirellulaceae bacterium]